MQSFGDLQEARPESKTVLVCRDQKSGALFAGVANSKGAEDAYSTAFALEGLKFCGHPDVMIVSDTERSIRSVADLLVRRYPKKATAQPTRKGDSQANGAAERAVLELGNQVRTLKIAFEARYPEAKVTEDSLIFAWMVRHAGWLVARYGVKQDGRTAYERLRGRTYKGEVAECGEVVLYKISNQGLRKLEDRWACGVWLGKSLSNDEHFIATADGTQRCRSIRRRVEKKQFMKEYLDKMVGTPWQPRGVPERTPLAPGRPLPQGRLEGNMAKPKGVYITAERLIKYGRTEGCPGCDVPYGEAPARHNAECRARFNELVAKETGKQEAGDGGMFRWKPVKAPRREARLRRRQRRSSPAAPASEIEGTSSEGTKEARTEASGDPPSSPRTPGRTREAEGPARQGDDGGEASHAPRVAL